MEDDRSKGLLGNKTFRTRVISGVIAAAIFFTCLILGGYYLWGLILVVSLIGLFEMNRALKLNWGVFAWTGYAFAVVYYVLLAIFNSMALSFTLIGIFLAVELGVFVFTFPRYQLEQVFCGFFEVFYVPIALSFVYLLRIHPPSGAYLVWLVFISAFGSDIFAYLIGMLFGKHPLVPKLSPKKSIEGAVGGLLGAVVLALIYALIVRNHIPGVDSALLIFPIVSLFGAAASQVGDLAASAIKRKVGIKDFGKIIPGHGGILDRVDSVIIVAPIIYIVAIVLMLLGV